MKSILQSRAATATIAAVASVGLFMGGMAFAGGGGDPAVKFSGGSQVQSKVATSGLGFDVSGYNIWRSVPDARLTVNVPAGATRLITARFSAESDCSVDAGVSQDWCGMRIMAKKAGGQAMELYPRVGHEYAFDSDDSGQERWESNSFNRSIKLQSGSWDIWVQAQNYASAKAVGGFFIDDFHFEVEVSKAS